MRITITARLNDIRKEIKEDSFQESFSKSLSLSNQKKKFAKKINTIQKTISLKNLELYNSYDKHLQSDNKFNIMNNSDCFLKNIIVKTPQLRISRLFKSFYGNGNESNSKSEIKAKNKMIQRIDKINPEFDKRKENYIKNMLSRTDKMGLIKKIESFEKVGISNTPFQLMERQYDRLLFKHNSILNKWKGINKKIRELNNLRLQREVMKVEEFRSQFAIGLHFGAIEKHKNNAESRKKDRISNIYHNRYTGLEKDSSLYRLSIPKYRNNKFEDLKII